MLKLGEPEINKIMKNIKLMELLIFVFYVQFTPDQLVLQNTIQSYQWTYNSSEDQTEISVETDQNPRFLEFIP